MSITFTVLGPWLCGELVNKLTFDFEVIHSFSPMFGVFIAFNKECVHNAIGFPPLPPGATDVAVEF